MLVFIVMFAMPIRLEVVSVFELAPCEPKNNPPDALYIRIIPKRSQKTGGHVIRCFLGSPGHADTLEVHKSAILLGGHI